MQDRFVSLTLKWGRLLGDATSRLETLADLYSRQAEEVVSNYVGYFEAARNVMAGDIVAMRQAMGATEFAINATEQWLTSVVGAREMRFSTPLNYSMRRLSQALKSLLLTHKRLKEAFIEIIRIAEEKVS